MLARDRMVIVGAHPDDETAGAAGVLLRCDPANVWVVTVTDGAPRNPSDALRAGYEKREDYAAARRRELLNALELARIPQERALTLNVGDQEASLHMADLAAQIQELLAELRPSVVLTHPYEGGHPDHDAAAFAVHAACAMLTPPPQILEFTSYHADPDRPNQMRLGHFLPGGDSGELVGLTEEESQRKQQMLECFASQFHMLQHFPVHEERFRGAPAYEFTEAPHAGTLFYENFDWGVSGEQWRRLAAETLRALAIPERV
jgi:LmbE family N-acetylglucosaminyl deacetylase